MSRVREFHRAFGLPAPDGPTLPDADLVSFRMRLIREEYEEARTDFDRLLIALRSGRRDSEVVDALQAVVKEVADLIYVAEGTLVSFGVYPDAYDEVHRSNMSKLGEDGQPLRRADGKVLKGPNYSPAEAAKLFPSIIDHQEE